MNHRRFSPGVLAAALFVAAYLAAAIVAAILSGNREFIFYIVVMTILIGAILIVHWRIGLSTGLLWCLAIWGALHMAGGLVPVPASWPINGEHRVLYSWWIIPSGNGPQESSGGYLKYDHVTHAFGFGITTWLCWQGLRGGRGALHKRLARPLEPTFGSMVLCAAAATGFGALNEIVEFIATMIAETNVGGYVNTGWDLVANATGAVIAAVIISLLGRRASPAPAEHRR
jgi:hypothetical protein